MPRQVTSNGGRSRSSKIKSIFLHIIGPRRPGDTSVGIWCAFKPIIQGENDKGIENMDNPVVDVRRQLIHRGILIDTVIM